MTKEPVEKSRRKRRKRTEPRLKREHASLLGLELTRETAPWSSHVPFRIESLEEKARRSSVGNAAKAAKARAKSVLQEIERESKGIR